MKRTTQKTIAEALAEIMERSPAAAAVLERQAQAFAVEATAEARIVGLAVAMVKPALPAIVNAVPWSRLRAVEVADGLWLMEDATFRERDASPEVGYQGTEIGVEEAAASWEPVEILSNLSRLLQRQIEGRHGSAQRAELHAKRLAALAALVEEG